MKDCTWISCEICVNDACPVCCDYCPVAGDYYEICKFYEPVESEEEND